jgi:hypothetical protein
VAVIAYLYNNQIITSYCTVVKGQFVASGLLQSPFARWAGPQATAKNLLVGVSGGLSRQIPPQEIALVAMLPFSAPPALLVLGHGAIAQRQQKAKKSLKIVYESIVI